MARYTIKDPPCSLPEVSSTGLLERTAEIQAQEKLRNEFLD